MNVKKLISATMLLLVVGSVVILVGRELREPAPESLAPAAETLPENALVVYYFHAKTRCPSCGSIERYSQTAIETAFAESLGREVLWRVLNYEQPENAHFVVDFEIVAPSVVLVRRIDGKQTDWRNLDRVWELIGDRSAFTEYVQNEARSMLGS